MNVYEVAIKFFVFRHRFIVITESHDKAASIGWDLVGQKGLPVRGSVVGIRFLSDATKNGSIEI